MASHKHFMAYDENVLKPLGLGAVPVRPPSYCGGIGGQAKVLGAYMTPIGIGGIPGVLSVVVVSGDSVPWLLPVGLMKALKGQIDLDTEEVRWKIHPTAKSALEFLPSGHCVLPIDDGVQYFKKEFPNPGRFSAPRSTSST